MIKNYDILKQTSGLALFSFFLAILCWIFHITQDYFTYPTDQLLRVISEKGSFTAVLTGLVALLYIKKKKIKGKWFAIIGIILGLFGSIIFISVRP